MTFYNPTQVYISYAHCESAKNLFKHGFTCKPHLGVLVGLQALSNNQGNVSGRSVHQERIIYCLM